jgi:hypothetical protein
MERHEVVKYWLESSDDDYQVMQSLFEEKIAAAKEFRQWLLKKINF